MRITVCIRQGRDGEISPFDACAYEAALEIPGAEITLLSMGAPSTADFLLKLTRLGAQRAVLLTDRAFAGADTLATAYALSLAVRRLSPDLILCGRQTLIGDTAQTPPMLAEMLGYDIITEVMGINELQDGYVGCATRSEGVQTARLPALLTVERINTLRFPKMRSKTGELLTWSAADIGADPAKCGLAGSPTRVLETFENQAGKRKCTFIPRAELPRAIEEGLRRSEALTTVADKATGERLGRVFAVGRACANFAKSVCDNVVDIDGQDATEICQRIRAEDPDAVIFGSDARSKRTAAQVAARLSLGLCADCTHLACEGGKLMMYRPALSGSVIAKIKSLTRPAMATVRTENKSKDQIILGAGFGVRDRMERVEALCAELHATLGASRKLVDHGYASYDRQIGLTGKIVIPPVYIAVGISGAVHHICFFAFSRAYGII